MATFWKIAAHSVNHVLFCILTIFNIRYFPFGFEGWIWVLMASVPDLCILLTFLLADPQNIQRNLLFLFTAMKPSCHTARIERTAEGGQEMCEKFLFFKCTINTIIKRKSWCIYANANLFWKKKITSLRKHAYAIYCDLF